MLLTLPGRRSATQGRVDVLMHPVPIPGFPLTRASINGILSYQGLAINLDAMSS